MQIKELGHIVFYVENVERSVHFYRDVLGFTLIASARGVAVFSSGRTHHELLLIEVGSGPRPKDPFRAGFYHAGFKVGESDEELQSAYDELREAGVRVIGMADHTVTHSLYIEDPDGNELELYVDVGDEWKTNPELIMAPVRPLSLH